MQLDDGVVVMLQIRHVPDDVHATLKERAARSGMSLSEYALAELTKVAARPTLEEVRQRIAARSPVEVGAGAVVEALDALRRERDEQLLTAVEPHGDDL